MNKEKGIYELLPSEPVDVAAMLIKATGCYRRTGIRTVPNA